MEPATNAPSTKQRRQWSVFGLLLADVFLVLVALTASMGLAHSFDFPGGPLRFVVSYALPTAALAFALLAWRRLYRINARYLGVFDLLNMALVASGLGAGLRVFSWLDGDPGPRSAAWTAPVLFAFSACAILACGRLYQRLVAHRALRLAGSRRRRALIVGAGDTGESLLREIEKMTPPQYVAVGFLDDDPRRHGTTIHGVEVLGPVSSAPRVALDLAVDDILIALPNAGNEEMRRVFSLCTQSSARVRSVPSFSKFVAGGADVLAHLREVRVTDLLRRDCAVGEASPAMRYLSGERVLITGGGGSIGSELARQVAALAPASLIILGKGENSIFEIHQELRDANVQGCLPVVCDVRDVQALEQVFRQHTPTVVIHAAAHKHVPLMEDVPIEAIRNNVFGTLNLAEVAIRHGVQRFILVSTDKAVKPENVMGATKRVAEMTVSALAGRSETAFATVRFGNVLGSRGSLVPILRRQILAGGPVTLTHPEMTRFFMTIPEAVELILQAGAMGEKGEIFILDMGEPISIVQLATDMIRLHGLVPGEDIEIKYTGIRPGEKLHEELAAENEALLPSQNERISVVRPSVAADWHWLGQQLEDLKQLCDSGDVLAARAALMELAWGKTLPPVPPSGEAPVPGRFADRQ